MLAVRGAIDEFVQRFVSRVSLLEQWRCGGLTSGFVH